jgi:sulfur carrier protein ThiS
VENFRPAEDATIAERVAYAAWLDEAGLRDEATAQWSAIAADGGPVPRFRIAQQSGE